MKWLSFILIMGASWVMNPNFCLGQDQDQDQDQGRNQDQGKNQGHNTLQLSPPIPVISPTIFEDSICIELVLDMDDVNIQWKTDTGNWNSYRKPFIWNKSTTFYARSTAKGYRNSEPISFDVIKMGRPFNLQSLPPPNSKYPGKSLTDGIKGDNSYLNEQWMGFDQDSITFRISPDQNLKSLRLEFLEDQNSWIMEPHRISVKTVSKDGQKIKSGISFATPMNPFPSIEGRPSQRSFFLNLPTITQNPNQVYWEITIVAATLPEGHPGAGNKAWIFIDEILAYE